MLYYASPQNFEIILNSIRYSRLRSDETQTNNREIQMVFGLVILFSTRIATEMFCIIPICTNEHVLVFILLCYVDQF